MSQNIKNMFNNNKSGFTLIELLIAIAVFAIISIISVQGLYDIVSIRAKQQTIEDSSDSLRTIARLISKSVTEADRVAIENSGTLLKTENNYECHTFQYSSGLILHKISKSTEPTETDPGTPCTPPTPAITDTITTEDLSIDSFTVTSIDGNKAISLSITGSHTNSLGDHPIKYSTTIARRN